MPCTSEQFGTSRGFSKFGNLHLNCKFSKYNFDLIRHIDKHDNIRDTLTTSKDQCRIKKKSNSLGVWWMGKHCCKFCLSHINFTCIFNHFFPKLSKEGGGWGQ